MKNYVQRAFLICGYLLLIVWTAGFKMEELFNLKELFLVIVGCLLLTVPYILEKKTKEELLEIAGNNSMLSSYMAAFVLILGKAGLMQPGKVMLREILLSLRPILYGFVMMVLLKRPEENQKEMQNEQKSLMADREEVQEEQSKTEVIEPIEQEQGYIESEQAAARKNGMEEKETTENRCHRMGLTARETEIVKLVLGGLSNREIGEQLYIAESTVKKHMSHIFEKLAVQNREQLKQMFGK